MKIKLLGTALLLLSGLSLVSVTHAKDYDITKDGGYGCCGGLLGPGSFVIRNATGQFSLGMVNRFIPTYENDWDFGLRDTLVSQGDAAGNDLRAGASWGEIHFAEGGLLGGDYIRNEFNLFFNFLSNDGRASFHAHLAYDNLLDVASGDSGGKVGAGTSDFGVERLNGSMALTDTLRLHAGFEFVDIDTVGGASLMFGDDTAAAWLVGKPSDNLWFNIGYHIFNERNKLSRPTENAFQAGAGEQCSIGIDNDFDGIGSPFQCEAGDSDDREAIMGFVNYTAGASNFRFMYTFDSSKNETVAELNAFLNGNPNFGFANESDFDVHHFGAYWNASFGAVKTHLGAYYNTGSAEIGGGVDLVNLATGINTGEDDFDVEAFAFSGSIDWQVTPSFTLRADTIYTSGDDDGNDGDLEGFICVMCDQRFSAWGGENTFVGDGNFALGLPVFSHLPEALGNGTPVKVGGIANFDGGFSGGAGRGDNPGYWEASLVGTWQIKPHIKFKSRARYMRWNEDFLAAQNPGVTPAAGQVLTANGFVEVDEEEIGWEWSNQLDWGLTPNTTIKTQASFFFAGDGVEQLIEAYAGEEDDETATRIAAEFVWAF